MWIPKLFGGKGKNLPSSCPTIEEISSACVGIANVMGVTYLGLTSLMTTFNYIRRNGRRCSPMEIFTPYGEAEYVSEGNV